MSDWSGYTNMGTSEPYRPGMLIGDKFVLLRLIAEGAVGAVYEAKDELIQRHVAIKLLHPQHVQNPEMVRRFRREAEATASVQHPNVVTILEMGQRRDGSFYIVQELLKGADLRAHLLARKRFSPEDAISILVPVMSALVAAHNLGIIHRDVKPENIVLASSGSGELVPKLIDFGVAKVNPVGATQLTQVGELLGTASYMSPEQVNGHHTIDARVDVWALGAVLYELLAGARPYEGPNPQSIIVKILMEPVPRIETLVRDVPGRLSTVVHRALERDPAARYPSMQAFREDLLALVGRSSHLLSRTHAVQLNDEGAPQRLQRTGSSTASAAKAAPESRPSMVPPSSRGEAWLDPDDLVPLDDDPASSTRVEVALAEAVPAPRALASRIELDWADSTSRAMNAPDPRVDAADHALTVNRLHEAISLAQSAIEGGALPVGTVGRMQLVQAIAYRWLGHYGASEQRALEAAKNLPRESGAWYAALGYAVIAAGHLGNRKRLLSILEEVKKIEAADAKADFHAILNCRLAIFLLRSGLHNVAQKIYLDTQRLVERRGAIELIVRAWLDATRAELEMNRGDLTHYLRRLESSVESFTAAGDLRNACLQRANIGNAFMQFGAYKRAAALFTEAIAVAEPMKLDFVASVKANLGFALAQLGELDRAIEIASTALEHGIQQKDKRAEGFTRIYLATMHAMRGDKALALSAARQAVDMLDGATASRAYGLATLGLLLLEAGQAAPALACAQEAMELMKKLNGVEEGESLIRRLYALSLRATGEEPEGRWQIADARKRLLERADRIKDPHWRQSFLERVPDNANLLRLAAEWLDGEDELTAPRLMH